MKITCQSCQSKYTIADEKIHGKIAKIRCRKCGETIEIDGTRLGTEASETSADSTGAANEQVWTVNLADDDQRSMTLSEVVDAYNSGAITAETYLWAEGMADWAPLAEVPEVVAALGSGMPPAADDGAEPVRDSMFHEPPYAQGFDAQSMGAAEEPAAAVVRPASGVDLFGGQEPAPDSEETRSPLSTPQPPLGARDEQSVLFSLSALTASAPKISVPPSTTGTTEDSGLIDLNALAAKSQQDAASLAEPTPAPTPFLFPAALGSVEPVTTTTAPEAPANQKSSKAPIFIGAGIAIAGVALALVMATRPAELPPAPAPTPAAVAPTAEAENAEPAPAPTAEPAPEPAASAAPAASAEEPAPVAKKPATTKPAAKPAAKPASKPAAPSQGATKPASAPAPKKSNCGCAPADLQCQIRCSATGK